jgi:DNA-binding NarL/FixJ family response regulator
MKTKSSVTVVVAHHQKAGRDACLRALQLEEGIRVVEEVRTGLQAIAAVRRVKPNILLFDLDLTRGNDAALLHALRLKSPRTRIILLIRRASESRIMAALARGTTGYVEEDVISSFLPRAIREVNSGDTWISRKIVARIAEVIDGHGSPTSCVSPFQQAIYE